MRIGSLCSGIGGLDLAVEEHYGASLAWCADNDPHASTVMRRHWPGAPNLGDLTRLDWGRVPPVDIITAGYPCQPFSQAGRRKGSDDERHLWPHIRDAIDTLRPSVVVLENVTGHLRLGASEVVADLAAMGLGVRWGVVRASDAGAPHRRARWFCLGADTRGETLGFGSGLCTHDPSEVGWSRFDDVAPHSYGAASTVIDTFPAEYQPALRGWERTLGRRCPAPVDVGPNGGGRLSTDWLEWLMGLPSGWVTDPYGKTAFPWTDAPPDTGIPRRAQLKALGNGVVPQQAALALQLLDGAW